MRRSLLAALSFAAAIGCSSAHNEEAGAQEAAHTEGEFVHVENNPFFWDRSAPHEELQRDGLDLSKSLAKEHPLTERLQAWSDRIDKIVRAKVREGGVDLVAPRPILKVVPAKDGLNAWVSGTVLCLGAPFAGNSAFPAASHTLLDTLQHGGFGLADFGLATCRKSAEWPGLSSFVDEWSKLGSTCDLSLGADGKFSSYKCPSGASEETAIVATTPWIHFTTDLLARVDEKTAVVILGHELAHYYRAHTTSLAGHRYGFWYDKDAALPMRPLPHERQDQLSARYLEVFRAPQGRQIANATYHRRLFRGIAFLAGSLEQRTDPAWVCANAVAKIGPWRGAFLYSAEDNYSDAVKAGYLAFERELVACSSALKLAADGGADAFARFTFENAFRQAGFTSDIPGLASAATFTEAFAAVTTAARAMDSEEAAMLEGLRAGRIGLYTTEQEADDIAVELSTKLGITAGEILGGWLKFMKAGEDAFGVAPEGETGDFGYSKCKALYDAGFEETGPDGKKRRVQMSIGQMESPHHGSCYRLYNMWRENNAHRYQVTATFTPPAGPSWAELAEQAAVLSGLSRPPPEATKPPEDVPPAVSPSGDKPSYGDNDPSGGDEDPSGGDEPTKKTATTGGCTVATGAGDRQTPLAALALVAIGFVLGVRRRRSSAR